MILGFKQHFPWHEPTFFREKILLGAGKTVIIPEMNVVMDNKKPGYVSHVSQNPILKPKLHTMREDKHNRWKPGMSIQMVYRGPKYSIKHEFNKGIPELSKCVSTQKVEIYYSDMNGTKSVSIHIDNELFGVVNFTDEGKPYFGLDEKEMKQFMYNDGFDSPEDFFRWFNKDWTGKLIHFTDLKY